MFVKNIVLFPATWNIELGCISVSVLTPWPGVDKGIFYVNVIQNLSSPV